MTRSKKTLNLACIVSLTALTIAASPARAQSTMTRSEDSGVTDVQSDIVVTGSRIRQVSPDVPQPIAVLGGAELRDRGFTNASDALNELPVTGIGNTPTGNQDAQSAGRNYINLFGLGSNRTLTLVNGRRFVSSNITAGSSAPAAGATTATAAPAGEQVDLNLIPIGLIDRVELVESGGSAAYGSDAIAGVVNIIMKKNFSGLEISAQSGVSRLGDAATHDARLTAGTGFLGGRGNIAFNAEYSQTSPLRYSDRAATAAFPAYATNPLNRTSTDGIPGAILIFDRRLPEVTAGGLPVLTNSSALSQIITIPTASGRVPAQFAPDGTLVPYNPGTFYSASVASGGDGFNLAPFTSLQTPVTRSLFTLLGNYEFSSRVRLFIEGTVALSRAKEPANQPLFNTALIGGLNGAVPVSINNPFLGTQARSLLQGQGINSFFLSRLSGDVIGSAPSTARTETYRGVVGLEGDLPVFGRNWHWDVAFNRGHVSGYASNPGVIQTRFTYAVDPVRDAATGRIVCNVTLANPASSDPNIRDCQPLNLFGAGAPSQAARDYLSNEFSTRYEVDQTNVVANLGGDLLKLPAGAVKLNFGYEYRRSSLAIRPDDATRTGIGRGSAVLPVSGGVHSHEGYVEGLLPIAGNDFTLPLLQSLDVTAAYRYVDNSRAGTNSAWSVGGKWVPLRGLSLRATRSRSFRAPGILELFSPQVTASTIASDPCDAQNITGGVSPQNRQTNCRAAFQRLGLPTNFALTSNVQAIALPVLSGGNPDLANETSDSYSLGGTLEPRFIPGFRVAADYVRTDIRNAISTFTLTSILSTCYDSPGGAEACNSFTRAANGQISSGRIGYINAGYTNFSGLTVTAQYDMKLDDLLRTSGIGRLLAKVDYYHLYKLETSIAGNGFDLNDDRGEIGNPTDSWKVELLYRNRGLYIDWTADWMSRSRFNNAFTTETRNILAVDSYILNNVVVGAMIDSTFNLKFGINNVFDAKPPYGTAGERVYDLIGQTFFVGLTKRF